MAITQKDIIEVIPKVIREEHFDLLLGFRTLAYRGWGSSKIHSFLDELVTLTLKGGDYTYLVNKKDCSYKLVGCVRCGDSKQIKQSVRNIWVDIPCPKCTANTSANAA